MVALLGKYICGNCDHEFDEQELICEDWQNPKKSMICPSCKHYLEIPRNWKSKYAIAITIFAFILGIVLSFINGFEGRPLTGTIFFIALPSWLWAYGDWFASTKTRSIGKSEI